MGLSDILYPPGATRLDPTLATGLFLILFSTQLTLTSPFSYLPSMVQSFGYSDTERGIYAGIIASSLFVGRFFGGYFWGWTTDKVGRRPVLLISASLTYVATVAFGFSTSFAIAVITRFLQGLFNGVIVCGRAAFAEICDDTNQALGVSLVFAAWNSAIVLGPALGGFMATPVKKYPNLFKGELAVFFTKFPFLLPSILVAAILFVSIVLIFFTFKETRPSSMSEKERLLEEEYQIQEKEDMDQIKLDSDDEGCCSSVRKWSLFELMSDKVVMLVIIMFGISGFCIIGFSELRSLWMATGLEYGGLTFSTDKIGIALLVPAIIAVVLQPIIFGRFERYFGGINTLRIALVVLMVVTAGFPNIHYAAGSKGWMWFFLVLLGIVRMISDISSRSALALFINYSVYSEQAGRANGLAFSMQEIMRVASPTMFGALFAWAIDESKHEVKFPIDFRLPFMTIALFILLDIILSVFLPQSINRPKQRLGPDGKPLKKKKKKQPTMDFGE